MDDGIEFVTIIWFDYLEDIRAFAGPECEIAVVPPKARQLLRRFDDRSTHMRFWRVPQESEPVLRKGRGRFRHSRDACGIMAGRT